MAAARTSLRFVVGTALLTIAADGCSKPRTRPEPVERPEITPEMWNETHNPPRTNMYYSDEAVRRAQTGEAESTPGDAADPKPPDAPPSAPQPDAT